MDTTIADKLLALRKQNGFSQEELAEKLGISRQAVSKWERAEASPDTENLIALARIYNISLDRLFEINTESVRADRSCINLKKNGGDTSVDMPSEDKMPQGYSGAPSSNFGTRVKYPENNSDSVEEIYPQLNKSGINNQTTGCKTQSEKIDFAKYSDYAETDNGNLQTNQSQSNSSSFENLHTADVVNQMSPLAEDKKYKAMLRFPYPVLATTIFLYYGAFMDLWHPMWMIFLTIPLYYTTIVAIKKKNLNIFCFPVLVLLFYFYIGFAMDLWHPGWFIFTSIPFYYWIVNIKK